MSIFDDEDMPDEDVKTPVFRQIPITRYPPANAHEFENRYRCIEARHEGRLYNSWVDGTFCMCGRVVWPGDRTVRLSEYERAEANADRPDGVGHAARAFLNRAHGGAE